MSILPFGVRGRGRTDGYFKMGLRRQRHQPHQFARRRISDLLMMSSVYALTTENKLHRFHKHPPSECCIVKGILWPPSWSLTRDVLDINAVRRGDRRLPVAFGASNQRFSKNTG